MTKAIDRFDDDSEKATFMEQMRNMRPDLFFPESWNDGQKAKAAEMVRPGKMRTSLFTSIPMVCHAEKCVFADVCPLMKQNLAPKGNPCPIEMSAVQQFMVEYMTQLGVEPDDLIEVAMVRDLVDLEIQTMRTTWLRSKEHFIQDNVVGVDAEGNPIMRKELHLAIEYDDRILRRKKSLREQLLATREARAKVGQGTQDTAQMVAKLVDQANQLHADREKALRKQLGYADDYDDYIDAEVIPPEPEDES